MTFRQALRGVLFTCRFGLGVWGGPESLHSDKPSGCLIPSRQAQKESLILRGAGSWPLSWRPLEFQSSRQNSQLPTEPRDPASCLLLFPFQTKFEMSLLKITEQLRKQAFPPCPSLLPTPTHHLPETSLDIFPSSSLGPPTAIPPLTKSPKSTCPPCHSLSSPLAELACQAYFNSSD